MKANAKAWFSKVIDIAEDREFWPKGKALVELQVCGYFMNLLQMADSDIPALYHDNFKLGKILQSMIRQILLNLISFYTHVHVLSTDIQLKWMAWWTDLHNLLGAAGGEVL